MRSMAIRFADDDACTYKFGHSDPDNSGLCIHCGAIIDVDEEDLERAKEEGRDPSTFPNASAYVANLKRHLA